MVLLVAGVFGCLQWIGLFTYFLIGTLRVPRLRDQDPKEPAAWPRLSIVVPACNEALTIEPALRSMLAQNYPFLEVVAVDDRSTDATGAILDRLALSEPALRVVHVSERPEDWLGKVNALKQGYDVASGELVLFSDADIHQAPGTLKKAVALFEERGLDHLVMLPRFEARGVLIGAILGAFFDGYLARVRSSNVEVNKNGPPFGFGAFNLIRRSTFDRTEGFVWFKMDILDDLAIGELMRRHGKSGLVVAAAELSLEYYASFRAAVVGWEKNMPAGMGRYNAFRLFGIALMVLQLSVAPFLLLLQDQQPELRWLIVAAIFSVALLALVSRRRFGKPFLHGLFHPFALFVMSFGVMRACWIWLRQGGVRWRGTFYSTERLRAGLRVTFP